MGVGAESRGGGAGSEEVGWFGSKTQELWLSSERMTGAGRIHTALSPASPCVHTPGRLWTPDLSDCPPVGRMLRTPGPEGLHHPRRADHGLQHLQDLGPELLQLASLLRTAGQAGQVQRLDC